MVRLLFFLFLATMLVFLLRAMLRPLFGESERKPAGPDGEILAPVTVSQIRFEDFDTVSGPRDPHNFQTVVHVKANRRGSMRMQEFRFRVATPGQEWNAIKVESDFAFADDLILVREFNAGVILRAIHEKINRMQPLSR